MKQTEKRFNRPINISNELAANIHVVVNKILIERSNQFSVGSTTTKKSFFSCSSIKISIKNSHQLAEKVDDFLAKLNHFAGIPFDHSFMF